MVMSRKIEAYTFRMPGAFKVLTRNVPSRLPGPVPVHPVVPEVQNPAESNHLYGAALLGAIPVAGIRPVVRFGRSFIVPSLLSSVPVMIASGKPLWKVTMAETVQPFNPKRAKRLSPL